MVADMGGKGKKPGGGMEDKLSEALRRAEEAVLRNGKLRDEEEDRPQKTKKKSEKKPSGRKPLNMKDLMPPKAARPTKPATTPKPAPEVPMVSFDRKKRPDAPKFGTPAASAPPQPAKPAAKPAKPAEPERPAAPEKPKPPAEGKKAAPSLGFGMVDLGGGTADAPELELGTTDTKPQETAYEKPEKKPAEEPPAQLPPVAPVEPEPPAAAPPEPPRAKPVEPEPPRHGEAFREYVPVAPKRSHARETKILLLILLAVVVVAAGVYGFLKWRESVDAEKAALKEQIDSASREALMDDTIKKEKYR